MSYYHIVSLRLKGVVKKEYRAAFESVALRGEWAKVSLSPCGWFASEYEQPELIPTGKVELMKEWLKEPWERSYDPETGEWIFQCEFDNTIDYGLFWSAFDEVIIPHCMESVELYEWAEWHGSAEAPVHSGIKKLIYADRKWEVPGEQEIEKGCKEREN